MTGIIDAYTPMTSGVKLAHSFKLDPWAASAYHQVANRSTDLYIAKLVPPATKNIVCLGVCCAVPACWSSTIYTIQTWLAPYQNDSDPASIDASSQISQKLEQL